MNRKNKMSFILIISLVVFMFVFIYTYVYRQIEMSNLNNMYKDIKILEDQIAIFYLENSSLPIKGDKLSNFYDKSVNTNDDIEGYYEIDLSKLNISNLTYGKKEKSMNDFYIVNDKSHTIYYYEGIKYQEQMFYTRDVEYAKINTKEH